MRDSEPFDRLLGALGKHEAERADRPRYRKIGELGRGGMSVVYRAWDEKLQREVALKMLLQEFAEFPEVQARFRREAEVIARLSHPNIVQVFDTGEAEGRLYQVMEWIRGEPLSRILDRRKMDRKTILELLEKIARALHHAHEQGIVHRDLKPANILVTPEGEPKVVDFGLAHLRRPDWKLTTGLGMLGTPLYMAPEQVEGGEITPRTDVWALGTVLYEALTGGTPHPGPTIAEVTRRIREETPVRPRVVDRGIHRDLETVCLKAIEKEPERRYPTALDFAEDLRRHRSGDPVFARPPSVGRRALRWVRRHRILSTAAGSVLALGVAIAALSARHSAERRRELERWRAEGRRAHDALRAARATASRLRAEDRREAPRDAAFWDHRRRIEETDREVARRCSDAVQAYTSALAIEPRDRESRAALADLYYEDLERAERDGDSERIRTYERLVRTYDDGRYAPRLVLTGTVSLDSDPPGAEVRLFRFEERPDRRLVPADERPLGRCPVGPVTLSTGSYLILLRLEGLRETRLTVLIERGAERRARVRLRTDAEIGSDFVHVPAGIFVRGGDPRAFQSYPRDPAATTEDFFISRREVTLGEYLEFLNDRSFHAIDEATKRVPRDPNGEQRPWPVREGRFVPPPQADLRRPVTHVTWHDAETYGRWLSARTNSTIRLPTSSEWEKAARGADGRSFPWGDHFDPAYVAQPATGSRLLDESPYGVLDLAGGVREWCLDSWSEGDLRRVTHGGAASATEEDLFRAATRFAMRAGQSIPALGFRVVRVPAP